jgi:hypothetical protein
LAFFSARRSTNAICCSLNLDFFINRFLPGQDGETKIFHLRAVQFPGRSQIDPNLKLGISARQLT